MLSGMMMDRPLLISGLIAHAARFHGDTEIVSREADGCLFRYTYAEAERRAKRLAQALLRLGIGPGDRVATLAWNDHRHYELYYGISGLGAVLHTVNPRLFADQLRYILDHAQDRVLFFEPGFRPLVEALAPTLAGIRHFVMLGAVEPEPSAVLPDLLGYESLLAAEDGRFDWPQFEETRASSLCYTSGTTGNPKGALYSHRSTLLHAFSSCAKDMLGVGAEDTVLPVVPMFHVNAWGTPYSCTMAGARLVLPGHALDGASLYRLIREEGVTLALGVPTIWLGLLDQAAKEGSAKEGLAKEGSGRAAFGRLERVVIGGSAAPASMIDAFEGRYGVRAVHAWGMTEMSPLGSVASYKQKHTAETAEAESARRAARLSQGRPPFLVEIKILDGDGIPLPHDGESVGELHVRGPWVIAGYYDDADADRGAFDRDGWFRTGDVAAIDSDGYIRITDRAKDVIKSGGEWISSIALEDAAMSHPEVAEAAVIGLPHPKWDERPLLVVVPRVAASGTPMPDLPARLIDFLRDKVARWWLPDEVVLVDRLPHTATGKIMKTRLRRDFAGHVLPTAEIPERST